MTKLQSSKVGVRKDSHVISKFKPKIRIIHIYAPEIIKTDVANFRELVQRLTGKPEDEEEQRGRTKKSKAAKSEQDHEHEFVNLQNGKRVIENEHDDEEGEVELANDDDIWRRSSKSNEKFSVFLDEFSELDGTFMQELSTVPVVDQN